MDLPLLIVEPSATARRMLQIALGAQDWTPTCVEAPAAALQAARAGRFAAMVVSADLHGHAGPDGYALAAQLRQTDAAACILLLTSARAPWDAARAEASGITGHLGRPFTAQALSEALRQALAARPSAGDGDAAALPPPPAARAPHASAPTPGDAATLCAGVGAAPTFASAPSRAPGTDGIGIGAGADALPTAEAAAPQAGRRDRPLADAAQAGQRPVAGPRPAAALATAFPVALPPLPDWDATAHAADVARAPSAVADAVAQTLARLAPNLDAAALNAKVQAVVAEQVVAILWDVVPKLVEKHLLGLQQAAAGPAARPPPGLGRRGGEA